MEIKTEKFQQEFLKQLWGECIGEKKLKHTVEIGQPYLTLLEAKVHEIHVEGNDKRISKTVFKIEIDGTVHEIVRTDSAIRTFNISWLNNENFRYFTKAILKSEDMNLYYTFVEATSKFGNELISRG